MRDLLAWFFASTLLAHSASAQHSSPIANVNEQLPFGALEEKIFAGANNLTALVAMASTSSGAGNGNLFANASSLSSSDLISLTGTKLTHLWMALGNIMLLLLVYACRHEARDRRVRDKWRRKKERAQEKETVEERNKGNQPQSSALQRCTLDGIATSCTQSGEGRGVQTPQVRMASMRPLPAPAEANLSKLSTPTELLLLPLPAQAATFSNGPYLSSTSLLWKEVDEVGGAHAADDVDELALAVSRAVMRAMPHGAQLFTCRPSSPISWQRTPEEDAFNGECKCRSMLRLVSAVWHRYAALLFVLMRLVPFVHGVRL